jgi:hypothetical protein
LEFVVQFDLPRPLGDLFKDLFFIINKKRGTKMNLRLNTQSKIRFNAMLAPQVIEATRQAKDDLKVRYQQAGIPNPKLLIGSTDPSDFIGISFGIIEKVANQAEKDARISAITGGRIPGVYAENEKFFAIHNGQKFLLGIQIES